MAQIVATRGYDIDLQLTRPLPTQDLLDRVRGVPGVTYAEPLGFHMVTPVPDGDVPIAGTHKDGGHGNLPMWALAADTRFPNRLLTGRQLESSDTDAIVVARGTLGSLGTTIGGTVVLAIDGQLTRLQVVGVVEGFGLGATSGVFASEGGLARVLGQQGLTQGLRIQTARQDPPSRRAVMQELVRSLRSVDAAIGDDQQADWINEVLRNHVAIVQGALQLLGLLMGIVGVFTLVSAMSTSVAERARVRNHADARRRASAHRRDRRCRRCVHWRTELARRASHQHRSVAVAGRHGLSISVRWPTGASTGAASSHWLAGGRAGRHGHCWCVSRQYRGAHDRSGDRRIYLEGW